MGSDAHKVISTNKSKKARVPPIGDKASQCEKDNARCLYLSKARYCAVPNFIYEMATTNIMRGYSSIYFAAQVCMERLLQLHALEALEKAAVSILVVLVIGGRREGLSH